MTKYITLLKEFVTQTISANEFESKFLEMFKNETAPISEREFQILDKLFGDVDAYCSEPNLFDPEFEIDEAELRLSAQKALDELRELTTV
jgi:hypothetical protein